MSEIASAMPIEPVQITGGQSPSSDSEQPLLLAETRNRGRPPLETTELDTLSTLQNNVGNDAPRRMEDRLCVFRLTYSGFVPRRAAAKVVIVLAFRVLESPLVFGPLKKHPFEQSQVDGIRITIKKLLEDPFNHRN